MKRRRISKKSQAAANRKRSQTMKQRWQEARNFSERHKTKLSLKNRTVEFQFDNKSINKAARDVFADKKSGRAIPTAADFRFRLKGPDGKEFESGPITIGKNATTKEIHAVMRTVFRGVISASFDSPTVGKILQADGAAGLKEAGWDMEIDRL